MLYIIYFSHIFLEIHCNLKQYSGRGCVNIFWILRTLIWKSKEATLLHRVLRKVLSEDWHRSPKHSSGLSQGSGEAAC